MEPEDPPERIVETTLSPQKTRTTETFDPGFIVTGMFFVCLVLSCLALQVFLVLHPPIATATIIPKATPVSLNGTLQFGRLVSSLTISQEAPTPTTGQGHQDARQARGTITFYNGQFQTISVQAGTILTGSSGVQIATDQDVTIPPGNPPTYGEVSVSAHAVSPGGKGNIPAYDIKQIFSNAVLVKNTTPFYNGQDARDYRTVTRQDIDTAALALKTTLAQSVTGALQGQLKQGEALQILPCTPTTIADHHIGQGATMVKVNVSETCSAVAYNNNELITKATDLLSHQALHTLGTSYSLIGTVQVTITQATATHTTPTLIFSCQGTWVYALSQEAQQHIKHLIAGKSRQKAIKLLLSLPGIAAATLEGEDNTKLPKGLDAIHLRIIVPNN